MLPSKTFYKAEHVLYDSNFDASGRVNPHKIAEFLQDAAGEHANLLGFGWDILDKTGCLWVLSKLRLRFFRPVTREVKSFTLYTWPLKPARFFAERCFSAVSGEQQLFAADSVWLVIDRDSRKIVSSERLAAIYDCDFDDAHCDVENKFERIRRDGDYAFAYSLEVRRSDLDVNGHVNNANYINYAANVLRPEERIEEMEIVYQKELRLGDKADIYVKRQGNRVYVAGEREETCFTALLTLE